MAKELTIDEAIRNSSLISIPDIEKIVSVKINAEADKIFYFLERIGGENGWFSYDSRQLMENVEKGRLMLKENFNKLCPKGKIDLFHIADFEKNKKLRLKFESAFAIGENSFFILQDKDGRAELVNVFRIKLKNFWGRLFWKLQKPFDGRIRNKMLNNIKKLAESFHIDN
jgi:hypothetical protein